MNALSDVVLVWISILLEALPFLLAGAAASAVIEEFVPDAVLERWLFRGGWTGILAASTAGLLVPACDCAIYPVVRRLLSKGLPPAQAAAYLCASSNLGPSVLAATWWAFPDDPGMVVARAASGLLLGLGAGGLASLAWKDGGVLREGSRVEEACACGHHHGDGPCGRSASDAKAGIGARLARTASRTSAELCGTLAWIVAGGLFAALVQVFLPRQFLYQMADRPFLAVPAMMALGFSLCLCANADAFVARTFAGILPPGALLAFMTFGGALDAKNLAMWLHGFRGRFVLLLAGFLVAAVLALGLSVPAGWLR